MLMCYKNRKFTNFYTGQTNDLYKRFDEHIENVESGDTDKYTGRFDFVKLTWNRKCKTRAEAKELERYVKGLSHSEKWDLVKGRSRI